MAFEDNLPLDGKVKINWPDKEPEVGIYIGYLVGNTRRCAVKTPDGTNTWIDRRLLETL